MTSVTHLYWDQCAACADKTLHDALGCMPCQKQRVAPTQQTPKAPCRIAEPLKGVELTPRPKRASTARKVLTPLHISIAEFMGAGKKRRQGAT